MLSDSNTIYEIRYDFDLNGKTLEVPENCTLKFEGGSLNNGTIKGNETYIQAIQTKIFSKLTLLGIYSNKDTYVEWFGAIPNKDYKEDSYEYIQYAIDNTPVNSTLIFKNDYFSSNQIILNNRGIDIYMTGIVYFPQNVNGFVFRAIDDTNNNIQNHTYRLNIYRINTSYNEDEHGGAKNYGLLLEGIRQATFDICITKFEGGVCLRSTEKLDCTYNKFFIRTLFNCTKTIVLDSITYDSNTTVAQNTFFGGRIGISGTFSKELESIDKEYNPLLSILGNNNTNNNNSFFGVSFEGEGVIRANISYGLFSCCRFEGIKKIIAEGKDAKIFVICSYGFKEIEKKGNISYLLSGTDAVLNQDAGPLILYSKTGTISKDVLKCLSTTQNVVATINNDGVINCSSVLLKRDKYVNHKENEQYEIVIGKKYNTLDEFKERQYRFLYNSADVYFKKDGILSKLISAKTKKDNLNIKGDMAIVNNIPIFCIGDNWICADGAREGIVRNGTTEKRPINGIYIGFCYYDSTLKKPIWWTGTKWIDATGADV